MTGVELEAAVVEAIGTDTLRGSEIAALVERKSSDGSLRRALARLVEAGRLERDGNHFRRVANDGNTAGGVTQPPPHLGAAGRTVWIAAHLLRSTERVDEAAVLHLARLEDEAVGMVGMIEGDGPVQREVIVSPRGDVVGHRLVAHPLIVQLRKLGAEIAVARSALGLDPKSRAALRAEQYDRRPDAIDQLQEQRRLRTLKLAANLAKEAQ